MSAPMWASPRTALILDTVGKRLLEPSFAGCRCLCGIAAKLHQRVGRIGGITANLLDNITSTNRDLVDRRLKELQREKALLEVRLEELAAAEVKEAEVQELTKELWDFLGRFEDTMASGPLEAKRAALRRFVKALSVRQQATRLEMELYGVPLPPALAPAAPAERVTVACSAVASSPQGGKG
jgi:hypothetical protein